MRSRFACVICASALFVYSTSASAQEPDAPDYSRPGFYLGVGVMGAAYTEYANTAEDLARALGYVVDIETDIPVAVDIYGGFRAHPRVALEAEFEILMAADVKEKSTGIKGAELETWAFTGNAKAFLMTEQFQPFLLVGLGVVNATEKDALGLGLEQSFTGFGARVGGGADYYFTENIAVFAKVSYMIATGDVDAADYVSFGGGLQYRF